VGACGGRECGRGDMSSVVWAVVVLVRWDGSGSVVVCVVGVGRWVCVVGECVVGGNGCRVMVGVVVGACGVVGVVICSVEAIICLVEACGGGGVVIGGRGCGGRDGAVARLVGTR
jgi:hypothetical protein